jgi:hypothetical protein
MVEGDLVLYTEIVEKLLRSSWRRFAAFLLIFLVLVIGYLSFGKPYSKYLKIKKEPVVLNIPPDVSLLSRSENKFGYLSDGGYTQPEINLWFGTNKSYQEVESYYLKELEKYNWEFNIRDEDKSIVSSTSHYLSFLKNGGCGEKGLCLTIRFIRPDHHDSLTFKTDGFPTVYVFSISANQQ